MRRSILTAALFLAALPAWADQTPPKDAEAAKEYQHCIELARTVPDEGWKEAAAWASMGGGEPAEHCEAVAMVGQRQFEEAATKLETLARDSQASRRVRAGMLAQAGQAWLLAEQPDRAFAAQSSALALMPGAPDVLVDRSESQAAKKDYQGALRDLDQALATSPNRIDALVFRATAKRHLDDMKGAKADIARALQLDDHDQDAWLEDGIEKRLEGDADGARRSWANVLSLAPRSDAAITARQDLDLLDAGDH